MVSNPQSYNKLCDVVALCYHEARNVRHLLRENLLDQEEWKFVVSLPNNRDVAWREIAPLRDRAYQTSEVDSALEVFESHFHVSLNQLRPMFANENWKHAKSYGGNAWAKVVELAMELAEALRADDTSATQTIESQIISSRHNNGLVLDKLAQLEKTLALNDDGS